MDVETIFAMPLEELKSLIKDNVGPEGDAQLWETLKDPELISTSVKVVNSIMADLQAQVAQRASESKAFRGACFERGPTGKQKWFEHEREHAQWHAKVQGYQRFVRARIDELNFALDSMSRQDSGKRGGKRGLHEHNSDLLLVLADAIRGHREATQSLGIKPEDHDTRLWQCLDRLEVATSKGMMALGAWADMVAAKTSKPS